MCISALSTQLNAKFRLMEHDTSAEKNELYRILMKKFSIQVEETNDAQRQLNIQEVGEIRRYENASGT